MLSNVQSWNCIQSQVNTILTFLSRRATTRTSTGSLQNFCVHSRCVHGGMSATPSQALVDDVSLKVYVAGLENLEQITLHSSLTERKYRFEAVAHYEADSAGTVDTTRDPSLGGNYTGVEPTGLLWGMEQALRQKPGLRLMKRDVTQPFTISLDAHRGHLRLEDLYMNTPTPLYSRTILRSYMGDGVQRIPVNNGRVRGTLFLPPGEGPFPGVIDMFGSMGGLVEFRAALFASRGIAALALAYFNYQDLPRWHYELELEYFEEAIELLLSHPKIRNDNGVGLVGVSKGCELAYAIAEISEKVRAVVGISGLCCSTDSTLKHRGKVLKASVVPDWKKSVFRNDIVLLGEGLATEIDESQVMHVEKSNASFLFIRGLDDKCVSPHQSGVAPERLRKSGRTDFEDLLYPGAGHLIEPPFSPHVRSYYYSFGPGLPTGFLYMGGERRSNAKAQEDSWPRILDFLKKKLG